MDNSLNNNLVPGFSERDSFEIAEWDFDTQTFKKRNITRKINFFNEVIDEIVKNISFANIIIPVILISLGLYFIGRQFLPDIQYHIQAKNGLYTQGTAALVSETYINLPDYISNPKGLGELTAQALNQHILQKDETSLNYNKVFYLSIPSLGFDKLAVEANVDSSTESAYIAALEDSLAHFKYTGLPISDVQNNIVIYGHSSAPSYNPKRSDPMVAFSFLDELKVGDDIYIEMEGKQFHYKMQRSKVVKPDEVSIITGTPGKRTLTLFTCTPDGSDENRYVAVAREV